MLGMKWSYFMVWELNIIAVGKAELKYGNRATVQKMGVKWGFDIITDRMGWLYDSITVYNVYVFAWDIELSFIYSNTKPKICCIIC